MASNGDWGVLVEHDQDMADAWDRFQPLPDPGTNPLLDAFVQRKNITIAALVRVGARLTGDGTLAFAFPGGIKYRDMDTGKRWNWIGSDFTELKIVRQGAEPSDTVIIAEGETDAAWLTTHFDVDVALLPAGARTWKRAFTDQVLPYARVLVGLDNDEAGEAGWTKIQTSVPHAQRLVPPGGKDWCEADTVVELPEGQAATAERVGNIIFQDLSAAWRGELGKPELVVEDLLYDQGVHWISGHPDSGKSIMAMHIAWMYMEKVGHVIWLDYEQGDRMTGQRLREMGVPLELIQERFHWAWYPAHAADELDAVADAYPGALIVFDSASKALSAEGIGENENQEVLDWTIKLIQVSKARAMPVIVIDHVAKSDTGSAYARGAGTKQADTDVHWKVEKVSDFNRRQIGTVCLSRKKDREASLPPTLYFTIGDGEGGLVVTPADNPADEGLPPV